jgi:hypothetical protein
MEHYSRIHKNMLGLLYTSSRNIRPDAADTHAIYAVETSGQRQLLGLPGDFAE